MIQHYRYSNKRYLRNSIRTDTEVLKACMYDLVELTSGQLYVLLTVHLVIICINNQPDTQLHYSCTNCFDVLTLACFFCLFCIAELYVLLTFSRYNLCK